MIAQWSCPYTVFADWMADAAAISTEPNAMTLATVDGSGRPSARMVLLKEMKHGAGFVFFTNYSSRKASELESNPNVALVFYWDELKRSIRVEGKATKVPEAESEAYFRSRPKASQIGSAVSPQSQLVPSRDWLWERNDEFEKQEQIDMPNWGGYLVEPEWIEFWQGQSNRLHDRVVFTQGAFDREKAMSEFSEGEIVQLEMGWSRSRLAP